MRSHATECELKPHNCGYARLAASKCRMRRPSQRCGREEPQERSAHRDRLTINDYSCPGIARPGVGKSVKDLSDRHHTAFILAQEGKQECYRTKAMHTNNAPLAHVTQC
jgi:hypothetical protein